MHAQDTCDQKLLTSNLCKALIDRHCASCNLIGWRQAKRPKDPYKLTRDEGAALHLYTMDTALYQVLNMV